MAATARKRKNKVKTYDLILRESIKLFNEYGIESVSIYRVAESIGISTGNLTYYFKRKRDLISALIEQVHAEMVDCFENFPYEQGADEFIRAYAETFTLSWQYRFLFNSAPYLIQNDLVDPEAYEKLIGDISKSMAENTNSLIKQGLMTPVSAPYNVEMLIDCIWWQWLGWLRVNQLKPPRQRRPFNQILYSGINHSLFITRPYMKDAFFDELYEAMTKTLKGRK